ncbi:MAG: hypothetical protein IT206_02705 [Fimbriimonadaceae bacterium]|nr:hypothetical protein [Fimbriimonadaceae bacterium]
MLVTAALLTTALLGQTTLAPGKTPVLLNRKFVKGEYNAYKMNALLTVEIKEKGLDTFLPSETGYEYGFNTTVNSLDGDGNASMRYDRGPTYRLDNDEETLAIKKVKESDAFKLDLILTPINQFIEVKEVKPPKAAKLNVMLAQQASPTTITQILAGQYIMDLYRLSLFVGSLDSAFDFSPKLPDDPVKIGDTWLTTVSYQPQKTSSSGQTMVQRLDMKYRYDGQVSVNGKKVERVSASLSLDSELTSFINSQYGMSAGDSPIKGLRITFKSDITFDLEPKTFKTLRGQALSSGTVKLDWKGEEGTFAERKWTGESHFALSGTKIVKVASPGGSGHPKP